MHIRVQPNLQQMHRLISRVDFTVLHACTCAHQLPFTRVDLALIAHAVGMAQLTRQHIGQNLHIVVTMPPKAALCCNSIFIDHPQGRNTHKAWIVPTAERKAMFGIQPTHIDVTTIFTFMNIVVAVHVITPALIADHFRLDCRSVKKKPVFGRSLFSFY